MKKYTIIPVFLLSAVLSLKAQDNAAVSSIAAAADPEVSGNETSVPEVLRTASIDDVLAAVREHNPELAAITQDTEAQSLQLKNENILEDPSIEYSSFYSSGVTGQSGSELVVSQGFDFPTVYAARHRKNELSRSALENSLSSETRRILLDAKNLCLDIIMYRQIGELLGMQSEIADDLLALYEQRLESGDASALEVNKIRMELMSLATDVATNNAALDAAYRNLAAMNGGEKIIFEADEFPLTETVGDPETAVEEYLAEDASIMAAASAAEAARKEISVSKQGWIPKLEVGYRRNTAIRDAEHGFLVGCSIPLFSNHKKVAMAKAQSTAAQSTLNYARLNAEAEVRAILNEMEQTRAAIDAYNEPRTSDAGDSGPAETGCGRRRDLADRLLRGSFRNLRQSHRLHHAAEQLAETRRQAVPQSAIKVPARRHYLRHFSGIVSQIRPEWALSAAFCRDSDADNAETGTICCILPGF